MNKSTVVLFLLVAILYGWLAYVCYGNLVFDSENNAGFIVSALGAMVTLVVGWQILSNIQERERIKELRREFDSFKESIIRIMEERIKASAERNQNIILCVALAQMGLNQYINHDYSNAVRTLFNALSAEDEQDPLQTEARTHAIQMLEEISHMVTSNGKERLIIQVPEYDLRTYQLTALKLKNKLIIELSRQLQPRDEEPN